MPATPPDRARQPRSRFALWVGILGPPVIWLTQFQIKYTLAVQRPGSTAHVVLIVTGIVSLVLVGAMAVLAAREYRVAGASPLDIAARTTSANRFMAIVGLGSSGLFFLLIAAQAIADLFFEPGVR